jgi:hypothetical protein
MLSAMDHSDHYIFVQITLGKIDREVYSGSPFYLQEGEYFPDGEFMMVMEGCIVHTKSLVMIQLKLI